MTKAQTRSLGWVGALEAFLGHFTTRVVLSLAIVISLIPHDWLHANDVWFLLLFGPEFLARVVISCRKESEDGTPDPIDGTGWRFPRGGDVAMLLVDLIALISFLPLHGWLADHARWLRIFRLTRTVMLLRYWAPMVRDFWSVLRRRERARQLTLMACTVAIVAFAGTVFLNHATESVGEDFDGDGNVGDPHDHSFWVRMWWALRQIEDPGNMLTSPHETATLLVSIFLTVFGLFLVSFLIGLGTDVVAELMELSKLRSSGLKGHTVLINITPATRQLLFEVMAEFRKVMPEGVRPLTLRWVRKLWRNARQHREFVVVGAEHEPPDFLREPEFARIIYRENSDKNDEAFLHRADVPSARRVVVLADIEARDPDDDTVRTLLTIVERLREVVDEDQAARTTLVAEILDESNIGAAHKAIARASRQVDAHVVPTERLLALFVGSVARTKGLRRLVRELLASSGHELYSYDYREINDEGTAGQPPPVAGSIARTVDQLYWRGLNRPPARRVVPVGALMAPSLNDSRAQTRVALNPTEQDQALGHRESFAGFVALAPNLRVAGEFAQEVTDHPEALAPPVPPGTFALPQLVPTPANLTKKVLICGFRPATVNLIETIIGHQQDADVLVLVADSRARLAALDAFDGHANLAKHGLIDGVHGVFRPRENDDGLEYLLDGQHEPCGRVQVKIGNWTSSRQLMNLPLGFGSAPEADLIVMISSERQGSDAATTTALMKLEHLQDHDSRGHEQVIIAELVNVELAQRLSRRYEALGRHNVTVFSLHEMRALFLFQSVVVPSFRLLFGELMGPTGQSFVRLTAVGDRSGQATFAQLAAELRASGRTLVAVELLDGNSEPQLFIGQGDPDADDSIDMLRLAAVWVLRPGRASSSITDRYSALATEPVATGACE